MRSAASGGRSASRAVPACSLALAACATFDARADYEHAAAEIRAATGVAGVYLPGEDESGADRVRALCGEGLELREAVEVALLNNPALQAAFRSIGVAKADRLQAGLLANPSLAAVLRFPTSGGAIQFEGGLFGSLVDLWQRPARVDTAERALQRSILELAHRAVQLAGTVRVAYIECLAADRLEHIAEENRGTAARLLELVDARVAAQAATAIDANLARLDLSATELQLRDAELAASEARLTLAALLGFDALPAASVLAGALPEESVELPPLERLQQLALAHRLDVRAAGEAVQESVAELQKQRGLVVRTLEVGAVAQNEGDWSVGPGLEVELPLFDQNQAQIAKAAELLAQREKIFQAVRLAAVQEVGSTLARAAASWDTARMYAEQILTRSSETLDLTREAYRVGKTTIVPVLEAQRSLLEARRAHVQRLRAAASAVSELERATGTPRERLFDSDHEAAGVSQ